MINHLVIGQLELEHQLPQAKNMGKIAVYDSSAFRRGLRSLCSLRKQTTTNPKYEQTQNTNSKYEQTQNTKGFRSPRLQGAVYCNLAKI